MSNIERCLDGLSLFDVIFVVQVVTYFNVCFKAFKESSSSRTMDKIGFAIACFLNMNGY